MEYQKPVYFTITAPSLDIRKSLVTIVTENGYAVDWCHFSHFERIEEEKWRLVFIITKPYYYFTGQPSVRYGYITGILYGEDDELCKKFKVSDNIRIKQDGCLSEVIGHASENVVVMSQGCDFVIFLNEEDDIISPCSYEGLEFVTSDLAVIHQECEEFTMLITYETILEDECPFIDIISSDSATLVQDCGDINMVSLSDVTFTQECVYISFDGPDNNVVEPYCGIVSPIPSEKTELEQDCQDIRGVSDSKVDINQYCPGLALVSKRLSRINQNCPTIGILSKQNVVIVQDCGGITPVFSGDVDILQTGLSIGPVSNNRAIVGPNCEIIYDMVNGNIDVFSQR